MKVVSTNRQYHEHKPPLDTKIKIEGVTLIIRSSDFWNGSSAAGEAGNWERGYYFAEEFQPSR